MTQKRFTTNKKFGAILVVIIVLQVIAALCFCVQKQGYHYDENYSYYSSNVTAGLVPTDGEWMDTQDIEDEFVVLDGEGFNYGMVSLMQSYDVHPPLYYFILHTVCSETGGIFSKWQGLSINLVFYLASVLMVAIIAMRLGRGNQYVALFATAIYGFSPAVLSGVTFIRMYMMLTFLCLMCLLVHMKGLKMSDRTINGFYGPLVLTNFLGFLTHYYYVVFLFFLAAYTTLLFFSKKETRKQSYIYAGSVIGSLAAAVAVYPACLRHIFRGYRGTEAIGAFFDIGNLKDRASMFVGLLNDYVMCDTFYLVLLLIFLIYLAYAYRRNKAYNMSVKNGATDEVPSDSSVSSAQISGDEKGFTEGMLGISKEEARFIDKHCLGMTAVLTLGYFVVVLKTALMQAEEAVRYEMPIYGLIIVLLVIALVALINTFTKNAKPHVSGIISTLLLLCILVANINGLKNDKVLFTYKDDAENYKWAEEHINSDVVYIYNNDLQWMIWDDVHELMMYDRIYFISMDNDKDIQDAQLADTNEIIVYAMRGENTSKMIEKFMKNNESITQMSKVRELLYADVYVLN